MTQERDIEKHFVEKIWSLGGVALKFTVPGQRGWPDRLTILPGGRVIFVELKRSRRGITAELQKIRLKTLTSLGAEVHLLKTKAEIDTLFKDVK